MKIRLYPASALLALFAATALVAIGCESKPAADTSKEKKAADAKSGTGPVAKADDKKGDTKHDGWWCDEHGVPEAECSMCSAKVAKDCKAKGDWCAKHDRAKSQCFICDPKLKDKFAAIYKAKEGKDPPVPKDNE